MTTKKRFVGLCLLYCFSLPSSSVSGQKNPRSKRIRNITNTPGIFLRQKGNRNEPKGNRQRYTFATLSLAATRTWYLSQRWNTGGGAVKCYALYVHQ